jgi:hypothetical protein
MAQHKHNLPSKNSSSASNTSSLSEMNPVLAHGSEHSYGPRTIAREYTGLPVFVYVTIDMVLKQARNHEANQNDEVRFSQQNPSSSSLN